MGHSRTRLLAIFCVVVSIGSACSKPASKKVSNNPIAQATDAPVDPAVETLAPDVEAVPGGTPRARARTSATARTTPVNPTTDTAQATKIGALIKPQSTKCSVANCATYNGVTKDAVKLAFAYDKARCGFSIQTALSQAGALSSTGTQFYRPAPTSPQEQNEEEEESIRWLVKYFNEHAFQGADYLPQIRPLMGNDPERQFFGRKLEYVTVDGGSFQCLNTTRGAVSDIGDRVKPFAVLNNFDGAAWTMATTMNASIPASRRPMHFGTISLADKFYDQMAPFAWTQFMSGTGQVDKFASLMCSRYVGNKAVRDFNSSANAGGATRKFALAIIDLEEAKDVAADFKAGLDKYCASVGGRRILADEYIYSADPNQMPQQGTNMAVRFKNVNAITSVIWLEPVGPVFMLPMLSGQNYWPEHMFPGTAYLDSSYVQRIYDTLAPGQVNKAGMGSTSLGVHGGFGYGAGDPFWAWHEYHKVAPDGKPCDPRSENGMSRADANGGNKNLAVENFCKPPGANYVTWYYTILPMAACIVFAGPDLKPDTCTNGLQNYPRTRFGGSGPTTDPRPALVGARKGQFYFIQDATEWRWRSNFTSPYPEHKNGWIEYPDCQRHYFVWPDKLADQWEVNGPNWTKWCGHEKYAPDPYITNKGRPDERRYDEGNQPGSNYPAIDTGKNPGDLS